MGYRSPNIYPKSLKTWPCGGNGKRSLESDITMLLAAAMCGNWCYNVALCCALLCSAVLHFVLLCSAVLCCAVLCSTVLCSALLCSAALCGCAYAATGAALCHSSAIALPQCAALLYLLFAALGFALLRSTVLCCQSAATECLAVVFFFRILQEYFRNAGGDSKNTDTILIIFPRIFQECSGRFVGILQKRFKSVGIHSGIRHDYFRKASARRSAVERFPFPR